jgi:HEAT repeat protein
VLLLTGATWLAAVAPGTVRGDKRRPPLEVRRDTLEHHVKGLAGYLASGDIYERQEAEQGLLELGAKARGALPALIELLKREDLDRKHRACRVLAGIGPEAKPAVPWLVNALEGPQYPREIHRDLSNLHGSAALALAEIGPAAKGALPPLTRKMGDRKSHARACAAWAVWKITRDRARVAPVFHEILKTPGVSGRLTAAYFFSQVGADARRAIPTLAAIIRNPREDPYLVPQAAFALWKAARHEAAVPVLLRALKAGPNDWDAAESLAAIGRPARAAIPVLIDKLKPPSRDSDKDEWTRLGDVSIKRVFVRCLGQFGPEAKEAGAVLRALLKHGNPYLEMEAARALWQIEKAEKALAHLKRQLRAESPDVRLKAARLLHDLGKLPKEAVPAVTRLLKDKDFEVRGDAAELLKVIAPVAGKKRAWRRGR